MAILATFFLDSVLDEFWPRDRWRPVRISPHMALSLCMSRDMILGCHAFRFYNILFVCSMITGNSDPSGSIPSSISISALDGTIMRALASL